MNLNNKVALITGAAVGIGRAAKRGILFRSAEALEKFCFLLDLLLVCYPLTLTQGLLI